MATVIKIVLGFATLLLLVSVLVPIAKRLRVPFTVLMALVGAGLGFAAAGGGPDGGNVVLNSLQALQIPPDGFLYIFLPPLLFAGGLTVDVRRLFDDIAPVLVLAIFAVLLCTVAVGTTLYLAAGQGLILCLLLGSIVATTDTAAVLGIFRDIGVPSRLSVIVEGESLLNDAAAIALFVVLLGVHKAGMESASLLMGAREFAWGFVGGVVLGYAMAQFAGWVISQLRGAAVTEITVSVAIAYLTFVIGQSEELLHVSGIIAVVTAAMVFASDVRTRLSPGTWENLQITWRQLEFWATSLIFVLAAMRAPDMLGDLLWPDGLAIAAVFFSALVARALVLWGLIAGPLMARFVAADQQRIQGGVVLGGLRGAVTITLALYFVAEMRRESRICGNLPPDARFVFVMAMGYVFATLFIAAPSLRPLMKFLKLDKLSPEERLVRDRVMALSRARVREGLTSVARTLGLSDVLAPQHPAAHQGTSQPGASAVTIWCARA